MVPLPQKLLKPLFTNYKEYYRSKSWIFAKQKRTLPISPKRLPSALQPAVSEAKMRTKEDLHWLRRNYSTHLLESVTDLRYIPQLLRNKNSLTTEIYRHDATRRAQKIQTPFITNKNINLLQRNRHVTSYLLYLLNKTEHINKFGESLWNLPYAAAKKVHYFFAETKATAKIIISCLMHKLKPYEENNRKNCGN